MLHRCQSPRRAQTLSLAICALTPFDERSTQLQLEPAVHFHGDLTSDSSLRRRRQPNGAVFMSSPTVLRSTRSGVGRSAWALRPSIFRRPRQRWPAASKPACRSATTCLTSVPPAAFSPSVPYVGAGHLRLATAQPTLTLRHPANVRLRRILRRPAAEHRRFPRAAGCLVRWLRSAGDQRERCWKT